MSTIIRPGGHHLPVALALAASTLWAPLGGCAPGRIPLVDNGATIPPGAIPQPYGKFVGGYQESQTQKAEADDFVFYRREFTQGGVELGPGGVRHLGDLIARLPTSRCPIVVEPDPDAPAKDAPRREAIVARLAAAGFPDPDPRVVIAYPQAEGLFGDQAPAIYYQVVNPRGGQAGGLGGGLGGGGFGGAGLNGGLGGLGGGGGGGLGGAGGGLPF